MKVPSILAVTTLELLSSIPSYYCWARNASSMACKEFRKKLTPVYPFGGPERFPVPEDKIDWEVPFEDYNPPEFTTKKVLSAPWADSEDVKSIRFNAVDGNINRVSHWGPYKIEDGYPLNPVGRTGIRGRGNLGRWGPNHAADPVVTRSAITLIINNYFKRF